MVTHRAAMAGARCSSGIGARRERALENAAVDHRGSSMKTFSQA
ncbi:hypothetical protein ACQKJ1_24175 [Methylorubrum rhodesianum]